MTVHTSRMLILFIGLAAVGCASYRPTPLDQIPFQARAETLEEGDLRVTVSVLTREEAKQAFGVNLQKRGIQPIWLEIENRNEKPFWFMMTGLDPNYFSAHEAAYMNHYRFGGQQNKQMDAYFSDLGLDQRLMPGQTNSGFAFTNETLGTKQIRVKLYSSKDVRTFEFFISVPGVVSDWDREGLEEIVKGEEFFVESELELRDAIEALPCCTQRADGTGEGDPINIALIGGIPTLKAFIRSGWDETAFQRDFSSLFGAAYLYGRPPDVQFQKARRRVSSATSYVCGSRRFATGARSSSSAASRGVSILTSTRLCSMFSRTWRRPSRCAVTGWSVASAPSAGRRRDRILLAPRTGPTVIARSWR